MASLEMRKHQISRRDKAIKLQLAHKAIINDCKRITVQIGTKQTVFYLNAKQYRKYKRNKDKYIRNLQKKFNFYTRFGLDEKTVTLREEVDRYLEVNRIDKEDLNIKYSRKPSDFKKKELQKTILRNIKKKFHKCTTKSLANVLGISFNKLYIA